MVKKGAGTDTGMGYNLTTLYAFIVSRNQNYQSTSILRKLYENLDSPKRVIKPHSSLLLATFVIAHTIRPVSHSTLTCQSSSEPVRYGVEYRIHDRSSPFMGFTIIAHSSYGRHGVRAPIQ